MLGNKLKPAVSFDLSIYKQTRKREVGKEDSASTETLTNMPFMDPLPTNLLCLVCLSSENLLNEKCIMNF